MTKTPRKTTETEKTPRECLEEVVSYRERIKKKAGSERTKHKRKDARAHVKPTRPHTRQGKSRATSRITRRAIHQASYGATAKTREGRFAQKQMMTKRKSSGLKRMRQRFKSSKRLQHVDQQRIHPSTKSMSQRPSDKRSTHLKSSLDYPTKQLLSDDSNINREKKTQGMSRISVIKEARREVLNELLQNELGRYGAEAQQYKGGQHSHPNFPHKRKLKIKRGEVQTIRDLAKASQKSRDEYAQQQQKIRDMAAAREGQ